MTRGKGVTAYKVTHHTFSQFLWKNCHSIWLLPIWARYTLWFLNCRNMDRLQCSFNQVIDMWMSGEPSSSLFTAETMHSARIHLSATDALIKMAQGWAQTKSTCSFKRRVVHFEPSEGMGSAFNQWDAWGAETARRRYFSKDEPEVSIKQVNLTLCNGRSHNFCLCGWGGDKVVPDFFVHIERAESKEKSWLSETE